MPSVIKTFRFLSDAEGLADGGNHANIAFAHEPTDGDPSGCVKFTTSTNNLNQAKEYARRSSTGQTWVDWGVPSGAEVTGVQIIDWKQKVASDGGLTNFTLKARIIDSTGATVHSAGDLINSDAVPYTGAWEAKGSGNLRAVDFLAQESTEDVRLELEWLVTTQVAGTNVDARFDQFELYIEYDDGGGDNVPGQIPISNLDGLVFMKGFAYASRIGGTPDAIGMAALQECSISHAYGTAEARGPESLQPIGVGITDETLSGSIRYMVMNLEQFQVFIGGTLTYNGGTGKTTYTKKVNEEPSGFNLHLKTPLDGSDMEVYVYNCLATNQPIVEGGANREFKTFGVDWRAYGQTTAQGEKLFEVIAGGNQTGQS